MSDFLKSATAPDWVSAAIGMLALLLASFSLYLQWRDKRPRLSIRVQPGRRFRRLSYDPTTDRSDGEHQVAIVAVVSNTGNRPITLSKGFVRPLLGRAKPVSLDDVDYRFSEMAPDSSREVCVFPLEVMQGTNIFARLASLYRLEIRDHMDRRWSSGYARITSQTTAPS
jgi:hypothetical protein